mmetsp:Transcript_6027/g.18701  ORF Transcript_6027/g.18701 Transcript_6027/m.18701 type:complete len:248 (+) Transcript_6027:966-1709(+)
MAEVRREGRGGLAGALLVAPVREQVRPEIRDEPAAAHGPRGVHHCQEPPAPHRQAPGRPPFVQPGWGHGAPHEQRQGLLQQAARCRHDRRGGPLALLRRARGRRGHGEGHRGHHQDLGPQVGGDVKAGEELGLKPVQGPLPAGGHGVGEAGGVHRRVRLLLLPGAHRQRGPHRPHARRQAQGPGPPPGLRREPRRHPAAGGDGARVVAWQVRNRASRRPGPRRAPALRRRVHALHPHGRGPGAALQP